MQRRFQQVDVFTDVPLKGNPLAVVVDGDGLSTAEMQQFANWTNLSETTFLLPPTHPDADYLVRIFTTSEELPFAGHPTLGSCWVWLDNGGEPKRSGTVVQECGVGLVELAIEGDRAAFAAPPMIRTGDVDDHIVDQLARALQIDRSDIVDTQWIDNGPRWIGVLLADADRVLSICPDAAEMGDLHIGLAGQHPDGSEFAIEVRAFFQGGGGLSEDPVTGSLNASMAQWLIRTGRLEAPYVARQGTQLGRDGRIHISEGNGEIWVGGSVVTCVQGTVEL